MVTQRSGKTAFVFAGGGSLGAIQVGMLRVLLSSGIRPDFVVGASVGAINASYFAGAPNADGVAALEGIWSGLRRSDIFPFTLGSALGLIRHPANVVDPGGLRRVIETNLPYGRLEDAQIPLNIMATNQQGLAVCLAVGPAVEAILASTAIPGIFPTVEIGGEALMDGAIAANTPVHLAVELGASRIIILPTGYACALTEPPRRAIAKALHAITLMITWQLIYELERLPEDIQSISCRRFARSRSLPLISRRRVSSSSARHSRRGNGSTRAGLSGGHSPRNLHRIGTGAPGSSLERPFPSNMPRRQGQLWVRLGRAAVITAPPLLAQQWTFLLDLRPR